MTLLRRTLDASRLSAVANDPAVRPWLGGEGNLDLQGLLNSYDNIGLESEHGGFVLVQLEPGLYDVHSLFLPSGRGEHALACMREGLEYLFSSTNAYELVTKIPALNHPAKVLATKGGFSRRFILKDAWVVPDGTLDLEYWGLTLEHWALHSTSCFEAGGWFHDTLAAARTANHADDDVHDHLAGAVVLLCRAGQPEKAVSVYNRWARVADYRPIQIVSLAPVVLDIGDAVLEVNEGAMRVLKCA